jgi:hypothetical protein
MAGQNHCEASRVDQLNRLQYVLLGLGMKDWVIAAKNNSKTLSLIEKG